MTVADITKSDNTFNLKNWWGRTWADEGYGWLDYQTFKADLLALVRLTTEQ